MNLMQIDKVVFFLNVKNTYACVCISKPFCFFFLSLSLSLPPFPLFPHTNEVLFVYKSKCTKAMTLVHAKATKFTKTCFFNWFRPPPNCPNK